MENTTTSSPADKVIAAFDGVRATARALKRNPSSVSRWRKSREDGGTGGRVPSSLQELVLSEAKSRGLALTAADLIGSTTSAA
jgi:transposase-like protein